ncbi:MAG: CBS domain-containing protein [Planctomycetota bacterium]|nr:MAG: CBS domain-containing protein [Planctomycetota bacterium]
MTSIADIMSRDVETLRDDQTLLEAMQAMRALHVRHLPVLTDDGVLVGVVTDRDIKRATPSALDPSQREVWEKIVRSTPVSRIMSADPVTASPNTHFKHALRLFVEEKIGCLPVLADGKLVGIVTASDLFRAALAALQA